MKILTVRLPETLVAEIEAKSRARRLSKSDVVRERLSAANGGQSGLPALDAIADLIGWVDDLPDDLSSAKKQHLGPPAMAASVLVDAGFLVALLSRRDANHGWAAARRSALPPPWRTCDAALSEAFHLLGARGAPALASLLRRRALLSAFHLGDAPEDVLKLMHKYADVPMSLADACLVRMTEILPDPVLLTTDVDFRIMANAAPVPSSPSLRGEG